MAILNVSIRDEIYLFCIQEAMKCGLTVQEYIRKLIYEEMKVVNNKK